MPMTKKEDNTNNDARFETLERRITNDFQDGIHKPEITPPEKDGGYRDIELVALKPGRYHGVTYNSTVLEDGANTWVEREDGNISWFMLNHTTNVKDRAGPILESFYCDDRDAIIHKGRLTNREAIRLYDDGLLTTTSVEMVVGIDMDESEPQEMKAGWIRGTDNAFVHNPACKLCGFERFEEIQTHLKESNNKYFLEEDDMDDETLNKKVKTILQRLGVVKEEEESLEEVDSVDEAIVKTKESLETLKDEPISEVEPEEDVDVGVSTEQVEELAEEVEVEPEPVKELAEEDDEAKQDDMDVMVIVEAMQKEMEALKERVTILEEAYQVQESEKNSLQETQILEDIIKKAQLLELDLKQDELLSEIEDIEEPSLRIKALQAIQKGYNKALKKLPEGMLPQVIDGELDLENPLKDEYSDEELREVEEELENLFIG